VLNVEGLNTVLFEMLVCFIFENVFDHARVIRVLLLLAESHYYADSSSGNLQTSKGMY
jgi:hypothetical protein